MAIMKAWGAFKGRRADGTIVYGIIPQMDGSDFAATNCGAASEAMRVVSQRKGIRPSAGSPWFPTGASIRRETGDRIGGLNPSQTTAASEREYGVPHASPRIDPWPNVTSRLWAGYAVDLLVSYGPINDANLGGSPGFRGNHRLVLVGIRSVTGGGTQVLSADPLYDGRRSGIWQGQRWISTSIMRQAAGKLDLGGGTTVDARYGPGYAYFVPSLTHTTTKKYRAVVPEGTYMRYWVSNGIIVGRSGKATGGFSADCTAPQYYPVKDGANVPGGNFRLVQLTSGSRDKQWINAKYAKEVR